MTFFQRKTEISESELDEEIMFLMNKYSEEEVHILQNMHGKIIVLKSICINIFL